MEAVIDRDEIMRIAAKDGEKKARYEYHSKEISIVDKILKEESKKAYKLGKNGIYKYHSKEFKTPEWKSPAIAIKDEMAKDRFPLALHYIVIDKNFIPKIERWLNKQNIFQLSSYAAGGSAQVFEAKIEGNKQNRVVFRLGAFDKSDLLGTYRVWSPFVLQPYSTTTITSKMGAKGSLCLELLPLIKHYPIILFLMKK